MKEHTVIKALRSFILGVEVSSLCLTGFHWSLLHGRRSVLCFEHTTVLSSSQATGDPYYLEAGRTILDNLNRFARVPCGFAAMKDVRTGSHEDR